MTGRGHAAVTAALAVALLVVAIAIRSASDVAPVLWGLALLAALVWLARARGLSAAALGLGRRTWGSGLRAGGGAALVVAAAYALALSVAPVRRLVAEPPDASWAGSLLSAAVVIPLATVLPEELAFRGVLWGSLSQGYGPRTATVVSSVLFGLWHVPSALSWGPANATVVNAVGDDVTGTVLRVGGTVLVTGVAGVLFAVLRSRSGSLLAPVLLHWAVNGAGVLFVLVADQWR